MLQEEAGAVRVLPAPARRFANGSLPVADQDLIAGFADSRSIALQAIENPDDVVVIVFDQLLAEAHDVGTARSALPGIALALSRHYRNGRQHERGRNSNRPKHD
jgi:hypothetical protein